MKSLAELSAMKEKIVAADKERQAAGGTTVVVGLATCGIAAGAKPVYDEFKKLIGEKKLDNVTLKQVGCIGMCRLEPIVEVFTGDHEKISYVHVKPEMVGDIVEKHLIGHEPVLEYTVGYAEK